MASPFVLTAQLALQGPKNTQQVLNQINKQLAGVKVAVSLAGTKKAVGDLSQINNQTKKVTKSVNGMSRSFAIATRRFAAFSVATRAVSLLTNRLSSAIDEAIKFQREMNKVAQVTGKTASELKFLEKAITGLSTSLGTSSGELTNVARILSQAGFAASDLKSALSTLAKTTLAPTFDDITSSAEGAVAIFNQFGKGAAALEGQFGAINAVAGKFAVESSDLIGAVRRVGGVFKSAGGNLNDLIALFTSVRSTTRESAESIATGLRTIFTRVQRPKTIEFLRKFGVELEDLGGKFVGPFEATRRLSEAFGDLPEGDVKLIRVGEELAGFRQIGKVIPLLQQFAIAEKARQVALAGVGSLDKDAATAQKTLAVQIQKVKEEYLALVRSFADTTTFKSLVKITLGLASSFAQILESLKPLLPLLATFAAVKIGSGLAGLVGSRLTRRATGGPVGLARGGVVPGSGSGDTVPAMLTPGEFVIKKSSVGKIGTGALSAMNSNRFASGGRVADISGGFGFNFIEDESKVKGSLSNYEIPISSLDSRAQDELLKRIPGNEERITRKGTGLSGIQTTALEKFVKKGGSPSDTTQGALVKLGVSPSKGAAKELDINTVRRQLRNRKGAGQLVKGFAPKSTITASGGFASVLNDNASDVFEQDIAQSLPKIFTKAVQNQKFQPPLSAGKKEKDVPLNKLISDNALQSVKGQFFEAFIRRAVGSEIKKSNGVDDFFDFKEGDSAGFKALFGSSIFPNEFKINNKPHNIISVYSKAIKEKKPPLKIQKKASGGGISGSDTVPALLTPGEFVINKGAASKIGAGNLNKMNKGGVAGFAKGGFVGGVQRLKNGGEAGFGGRAIAASLIIPTVAQSLLQFGDKSIEASDRLAKTTIGLERLSASATQLTFLFLGFQAANNKLKEWGQNLDKSSNKLEKVTNKAKDSVINSSIERDNLKQSVEGRQSKVIKLDQDQTRFKGSVDAAAKNVETKKAEQIAARDKFVRANQLKRSGATANRAGQTIGIDDTIARKKLRQTTNELIKAIKVENQVKKQSKVNLDKLARSTKRLTTFRSRANDATKKAAIAEQRLALLRKKTSGIRGLGRGVARAGAGAARAAAGPLAALTATSLIAQQIGGAFSEFAGRKRDIAESKGDVTGVAKATRAQGAIDLTTSLFTPSGIAQALFDDDFVKDAVEGANRKAAEAATSTAATGISSSFTKFEEGDRKDLKALESEQALTTSKALAELGNVSDEVRQNSLSTMQKSLAPTAELFGRTSKSSAELEASIRNLSGGSKELLDPLLKLAKAARAAAAAQEARGKLELDSLKITSTVKRAETARDNRIAGFETGSSPLEANLNTLQTSLSTLGSSAPGNRAIEGISRQLQSRGVDVSEGSLVGRQIDNASSANAFNEQFNDLVNNNDFLQGDQKEDFLRELTILAENSESDVVNTSVLDAIGNLRESSQGGRLKADELSGIGQTILDASQSVIGPLVLLSQAEIAHLKVINELTRKRRTVELEYIATQQKSINTQIEASKIISQFGGGKFSSQNELGARASQFNLRARDAGVGGLGSGTASDIGRVGSGIARRFQELQISATRGGLAGTGGLGVDEDRRKELQTANQSLILFTKQRIDLLKKEVDIVKQKNALEKSSIESLLSGDIEGFFKQQGAAGAASALRSGDTSALRAFSATDIAGGLQSIKEQLDATGGDRQGFERAASSVLGGFGLSGRSAQVFADTTPEIENFNRQIRDSAEQLGRQAGIAAELQSMTVSTAQVIIDATNVEFRNAQARGGVGQPVPLENQMVSQLNDFTDKAAAIAGALQNSSVKFSVPEGIKVFLEGADFLNISEKLKPFVNDLIGAYVKNLSLDPGGQPKQNFGVVPK